jgi:hypothetical protein
MVREGLWVAEVVSDYGGQAVHYVSVVELRDGKMWRDTRYYTEPFQAPEWKARWSSGWTPRRPITTIFREPPTGEVPRTIHLRP